jgi:(p)ppGpp synthase/HD superfamily hydrolase
MMSVDAAGALARLAHGGDRTRSGGLFIDHVRSVAEQLHDDPDPYAVPAALLHDAVEKGSMSWDDLRAAGADDRLIAVVHALTERDGETSEQYLARCAADPLALRIKRVDIADKLTGPHARSLSSEHVALLREHVMGRLALLERAAADPVDH